MKPKDYCKEDGKEVNCRAKKQDIIQFATHVPADSHFSFTVSISPLASLAGPPSWPGPRARSGWPACCDPLSYAPFSIFQQFEQLFLAYEHDVLF
jgi:hypothetical protein